jgi:hypothetical protein
MGHNKENFFTCVSMGKVFQNLLLNNYWARIFKFTWKLSDVVQNQDFKIVGAELQTMLTFASYR